GTRNYAHLERVNHILHDLHAMRHGLVGNLDLPTRMQGTWLRDVRTSFMPACGAHCGVLWRFHFLCTVAAINSGDALRAYVAGVLDRERQEYKRSQERKLPPEQVCKLAPINVPEVQQ